MGRFFTRRWLVRAGIAVVVLAALWSATALIVPPTFKSRAERIALETLGRRLTIGDVAFNPWTLALRVDDIALAGASDAAPPQLQIRQLRSKVSVSWVFRLAPVIDRLEIDAPMLRVTRLADGRYDIDDVLAAPRRGAGEGGAEPARFAAPQHRRPRRRGGLHRPAARDDASGARPRARRPLPQLAAVGARDQCRAAPRLHPRRQPLRLGRASPRRSPSAATASCASSSTASRSRPSSATCRAACRCSCSRGDAERRPVAGVRAAAEAVAQARGRRRRDRSKSPTRRRTTCSRSATSRCRSTSCGRSSAVRQAGASTSMRRMSLAVRNAAGRVNLLLAAETRGRDGNAGRPRAAADDRGERGERAASAARPASGAGAAARRRRRRRAGRRRLAALRPRRPARLERPDDRARRRRSRSPTSP